MSENGEIYTAGKNFTLPPAVTAWTNLTFARKVVSNVPNIHLGIYKNYQNFHPLIFYGHTRLRRVGADLPPLPPG